MKKQNLSLSHLETAWSLLVDELKALPVDKLGYERRQAMLTALSNLEATRQELVDVYAEPL